jgi:hypothetical protein
MDLPRAQLEIKVVPAIAFGVSRRLFFSRGGGSRLGAKMRRMGSRSTDPASRIIATRSGVCIDYLYGVDRTSEWLRGRTPLAAVQRQLFCSSGHMAAAGC